MFGAGANGILDVYLIQIYYRCMEREKVTEQKSQVRFPLEVWEAMKRLAKAHDRSFNGELIHALRLSMAEQHREQKHV